MSVAVSVGQSERVAVYEVPDNEMAIGSTLGGPKAVCIIKASGALKTVYSSDMGTELFGTVSLRHYDSRTGMHLAPQSTGKFIIHPEHQEHTFTLAGDVTVTEDVFVLSGEPKDDGSVDPPGVYLVIELRNSAQETVEIATFGFADLTRERNPWVFSNIFILSNLVRVQDGSIFLASEKPRKMRNGTIVLAHELTKHWIELEATITRYFPVR